MSNREVMQQALEYLDAPSAKLWPAGTQHRIIKALRAVLAEPVQEQEPVAWQWLNTGHFRKKLPRTAELGNWQPLYTHPPQRKPLTDAQLRAMFEIGEK